MTTTTTTNSSSSSPPNKGDHAVDLLQAFLDSISTNPNAIGSSSSSSSSSGSPGSNNGHSSLSYKYRKDQIDISSLAALEEILQSQQHQRQQPQQVLQHKHVVGVDDDRNTQTWSSTVETPITNTNMDVVIQSHSHSSNTGSNTTTDDTVNVYHQRPSIPQPPLPLLQNNNHDTNIGDNNYTKEQQQQTLSMTLTERYLHQQIQQNTKLLHELHQKMDTITSLLLSEQPPPPQSSSSSSSLVQQPLGVDGTSSTSQRRSKQHQLGGPALLRTIPPGSPPPTTTTTTVPPPPPPLSPLRRLKNILWDHPITSMFRKIIHLYVLYYTLNKRYCCYHREQQQQRNNNNNNNPNQNNNFDPFVIFKIIFMITILWSRLQPSSNSNTNHYSDIDNTEETSDVVFLLQLYGMTLLVIVFFMYRTGQLTFLYLFYYKYRIPQRVLLRPNTNPNPNTNDNDNDAVAAAAGHHQNHHDSSLQMLTADEIWNEHLLAVTEQQQPPPAPPNQQHPPPGPGRGRKGRGHPWDDWIQRIRHRIEWLLVHDWFRGAPIAVEQQQQQARAAAMLDPPPGNEHDNRNHNDTNTNPPLNRIPLPVPPPHVSPVTKFIRMVLVMIQDVIIFFVSFVLSILPVWRNIDPEALFNVFHQEQQVVLGDDNEIDDNNDENVRGDRALRQPNNDGGIPIVQPPIDPAE